MTPWLAYAGASALNVALAVFLAKWRRRALVAKWRRRALVAEAELEARKVLHVDDTPSTFGARSERVTK